MRVKNISARLPEISTILFVDDDRERVDIHTLGDGTEKGTYFRASDVANLVGVTKATTIVDTLDYNQYVKMGTGARDPLYITVEGLVQYIMSSNKARSGPYGRWIVKLIFAFATLDHEGVDELARPPLAAILPADFIPSSLTGICLIGTVGELLHQCTIDTDAADSDVVLNYGMSKTSHEHNGAFPGASRLVTCCMDSELAGKAVKGRHKERVSVPEESLAVVVKNVAAIVSERARQNPKVNYAHKLEMTTMELQFLKQSKDDLVLKRIEDKNELDRRGKQLNAYRLQVEKLNDKLHATTENLSIADERVFKLAMPANVRKRLRDM
ncbi:hypothetical protein SARC_03962 [Sphaeroforma arctica JP610]|uniref:Bro-N domain-containing protein n=1 Tax=Sphaeroforma arctica JP610 TaxID=667725 RepID=A0A0L0G4Q7_9EUKA|nr:hypothetical protein SARC_03962 [Sphaeroforma arctica JP610]KNC83786.1 hypothetical protein SARC_03962 [Sphaeroforma arctica JP610]|eukprot:XP_014157688.1 hypothetical protein SARC_03962 [Sphaeroforma arctica JP610]